MRGSISKEFFDQQLGEKERYITKNIAAEWEGVEKSMLTMQYSRNRGIVKEVIETCLEFRKSLKTKMDDMRE